MVNPGTPVVFGSFASSISMQSGAPTFGTPEPAMVLFSAAKLARRLGVPFRSGGSLNGAKIPDAQAALESLNTLWPTVLGGVNFVLHAAGWLEGGLVSDLRKFIIDADQCSAMSVFVEGPDISENGQAMEAIRQVGPGQHFLGCDHTQKNFETAFWTSKVSDNVTFEQWFSEGEKTQMERAGKIAKTLLDNYKPPEIDPSIDEELRSYIEKRKEELPNTEA
jgi:trimethylamine--corrinoid protein Co-methyltransferase